MIYFFIGVLCAAVVILIGTIAYDSNRFVTVEYHVRCRNLKRKYRFVMLSDLHNKRYGTHHENLLAAIDAQEPESILIAGDMLTSETPERFGPALELTETLAEKYPVYYANGNHEYRMKTDEKHYGSGYRRYHAQLKRCGVVFLENESLLLPEPGIRLYGVEIGKKFYQKVKKGRMDAAYLKRLLGKPSAGEYNILIAHNPDYFPAYAEWGADLVLSGHVHGGIMRLPLLGGVLSPALRLFPKYDGGLFQEGGSTMILGRGLGSHTIPIRIFNPGELIVVTLEPE